MTDVLVVVGPTASGKSDLAVEVCRALGTEPVGGEVVNADSMQLYRGMDIGTAKLPLPERRGVPHHLVDVLDLHEEASVAVFQDQARAAIADVASRGRLPVLVGGSSLYVRAVVDPLDFPGTDPAVRARWTERLERGGATALHAELAAVAPEAAAAILPSNTRRVVRALEVTELTGRPFVASLPPYESIYPQLRMVGLDVDRATLDERIEQRVDRMWADGLVDEVRGLLDHGLAEAPTASRALGYAQVLAFLRGEIDEAQARDLTVRGTRAFARRQDRMFRKDPRLVWLDPTSADLVDQTLALLG